MYGYLFRFTIAFILNQKTDGFILLPDNND